MLQLLPRHVFEHQVETHAWQGPRPRKLSYWSQLVAMLYAQLSAKKSLRDLVFSLDRHRQKLYHLGLTPAPLPPTTTPPRPPPPVSRGGAPRGLGGSRPPGPRRGGARAPGPPRGA